MLRNWICKKLNVKNVRTSIRLKRVEKKMSSTIQYNSEAGKCMKPTTKIKYKTETKNGRKWNIFSILDGYTIFILYFIIELYYLKKN